MTVYEQLVNRINEDPDDLWLVLSILADYLDECGNCDRAEAWRVIVQDGKRPVYWDKFTSILFDGWNWCQEIPDQELLPYQYPSIWQTSTSNKTKYGSCSDRGITEPLYPPCRTLFEAYDAYISVWLEAKTLGLVQGMEEVIHLLLHSDSFPHNEIQIQHIDANYPGIIPKIPIDFRISSFQNVGYRFSELKKIADAICYQHYVRLHITFGTDDNEELAVIRAKLQKFIPYPNDRCDLEYLTDDRVR